MSGKKSIDAQEALKLLEKHLNRGRGILKHQPVDRKVCEQWTNESREAVAQVYGAGSHRYREIVAANRKIFTSFDTDPSYYLTQVVANLHRELRVLENCVKEQRDAAAAEEALLAVKGIKKAKPRIPAFLWAENGAVAKDVKEALAKRDFDVSAASGDGVEALFNIAGQRDLRYAVVVLSSREHPAGSVSPDGLLIAGYMAGRLGRASVLVLVDGRNELPAATGFLRTIGLKERERWDAEVEADASKLRSQGGS